MGHCPLAPNDRIKHEGLYTFHIVLVRLKQVGLHTFEPYKKTMGEMIESERSNLDDVLEIVLETLFL
jgi:hypothetical protein